MNGLLQGWTRQTGAVLLLLTAGLIGGWARSQQQTYWLRLCHANMIHEFTSSESKIALTSECHFPAIPGWRVHWGIHNLSTLSFHSFEQVEDEPELIWSIQYRSLVSSLTVLSAILIFWPHRREHN